MLELPAEGIARRFGPEIVASLDRLMGRLADPRMPYAQPPRFRSRLELPAEAARHEGYLDACRRHGLHNIVTLAPTSTDDRMAANSAVASGFVYCMSRRGVTGAQLGLAPDIQSYLRRARQHLTVPMAVGFGICDRARLEQVLPYCDVATVGSALGLTD